jgi:SAM-dependent methyltransferase
MSPRPTFDSLAPHYWWLEWVTFGTLLQWCRTALIPRLGNCRRALVVGDGDGRFLAELLRANRTVTVDSVDLSQKMIDLARHRAARVAGGPGRTRFTRADVRTDPLPGAGYDLIVTNFFLDCFPAGQLEVVIDRLADSCGPGGQWVVGDFALPTNGWRRLAARVALAGMYAFFRVTTHIRAGRLVDPAAYLRARGFMLEAEESRLAGFLTARLWVRRI